MKRLLAAIAVVLSSCGSPAPQATVSENKEVPLPAFEFRGLKPGKTTVLEAQKAKAVDSCEKYDVDPHTTSCRFEKDSVGDIATGYTSVIFKDGKFDYFTTKFDTDQFDNILEQTSGIWGKPCSLTREELQNGFGAKFQGDEVRWCFAEGQLTVRRHASDDYHWGEFEFFTRHVVPTKKKYNSNNL